MTPGTISIHLIPSEHPSTDTGWPLLSPDERIRATSFVFPVHATHWIACRAALRKILGNTIHVPPADVPLVIQELGKPELAAPFDYLHFSLSHCEDLAVLALCVDGPVGVDVERASRASELPGCETTFCHPAELAALPPDPDARGRQLLDLWAAKEALLKALGTGFTHPPESVTIHGHTATSEVPLAGIENQTIHRLDHPALAGFSAAVSAPSSATRIEFSSFEESTFTQSSAITAARPAKPDG